MQKIIIKNFGAIEYAEVEIKKVLVLIGEQASGKSTIAKLIYFFKSLKEDLFIQIYQDTSRDSFDIPSDLTFPVREKFYDFFGSTFHLPDFEITFFYSFEEKKRIKLTLNQDKKLHVVQNFLNASFVNSASNIKKLLQRSLSTNKIHEQLAYEQDKIRHVERLSTLLNDFFASKQTASLFIIASRNVTVGYPKSFERYLLVDTQNNLDGNKKKAFQSKEQTIDETLMLKFMEKTEKTNDIFAKFRGFHGLIQSYEEDKNKQEELYFIKNKIEQILKGEYIIDAHGEKIIFDQKTKEYIRLRDSSSGQKEVIRILQDIFVIILEKSKVLRIVEEPEAHLFPVAQKQLIELLALMVNQDDDNQLIITTHSPYILSVFNNLLFAQRVVDKNPSAEAEVAELIPKEFWLKAKDFSAYSLGNSSIEEDPEYCESIFNQQTGAIKQNYLDAVSEMLGGDFNALYSIYTKNSRRR